MGGSDIETIWAVVRDANGTSRRGPIVFLRPAFLRRVLPFSLLFVNSSPASICSSRSSSSSSSYGRKSSSPTSMSSPSMSSPSSPSSYGRRSSPLMSLSSVLWRAVGALRGGRGSGRRLGQTASPRAPSPSPSPTMRDSDARCLGGIVGACSLMRSWGQDRGIPPRFAKQRRELPRFPH